MQQRSTSKLKEGNFIIGDPSEPDTGFTSITKDGTSNGALHYIGPDSSSIVPVSIPRTDLPSTATGYPSNELTAESDRLFAIHGGHHRYGRAGFQQKISASAVPYQEHAPHMSSTRPGWVDRSQAPARNAIPPVRSVPAEWICHSCYVRAEHLAPQCTLSLKDIHRLWKITRISRKVNAHAYQIRVTLELRLLSEVRRDDLLAKLRRHRQKTSQGYDDFADSR